jgi:hypothetical protein
VLSLYIQLHVAQYFHPIDKSDTDEWSDRQIRHPATNTKIVAQLYTEREIESQQITYQLFLRRNN